MNRGIHIFIHGSLFSTEQPQNYNQDNNHRTIEPYEGALSTDAEASALQDFYPSAMPPPPPQPNKWTKWAFGCPQSLYHASITGEQRAVWIIKG